MDVGNLIFGNTQFQELCTNVIVNAERTVILWSGQVAEDHLRGALVCGASPDLEHIFRAFGGFAVGIAREHGIDQPLIQRQLAAVVGDQQHIVHAAVYFPVADFFSPFRQRCHNFLLIRRGLQSDIVVICFRHGQVEHIGGLNVRHIFEKAHQLRQIIKLGEPRLGTVAGSLRGQLNGRDRLAVVGRPAVEML